MGLLLLSLTSHSVHAGLNHHHHDEPGQLSQQQWHALQHAQDNHRRDPRDLDKALELAQRKLTIANQLRAPSFSSDIPKILGPWWQDQTPTKLQVIQAAYWQHDHQFEKSRAALHSVLKREPGHVQAALILSAVEAAQGQWALSRKACAPLITQQAAWLSAACLGQSASNLSAVAQSLQLIQKRPGDGSAEDQWAAAIQRELESRLKNEQAIPTAAHPKE